MDNIILKTTNNGLVTHYKDGTLSVELDNILSIKKHVYKGMRAIKIEENNMDIIEVMDFGLNDNVLFLEIENQSTGEKSVIKKEVENNSNHHGWWIVSYPIL